MNELEQRRDLAACYRLMAHIGVEDLTYNHISARVPGEDAFLVKPLDIMYREVTASCLEKYRLDGAATAGGDRAHNALLVLHGSVLAARPDVQCVIHSHSAANVAVSVQKEGLLPLSQHALVFYGRLGYHAFEGYEFDLGMRDPLLDDLGAHQVVVLRNHGVLVTGRTVGEAYVLHHFFEMACRIQVGAQAGGRELVIPSADVCSRAARQVQAAQADAASPKDWPACLRLVRELYPSYAR